jgi:hypothetical protein
MKEIPMTKLEALRFISDHYGFEGQESNTFNDMLADRTTDPDTFTVKEITDSLKEEKRNDQNN